MGIGIGIGILHISAGYRDVGGISQALEISAKISVIGQISADYKYSYFSCKYL
jgi:hypothetical protein